MTKIPMIEVSSFSPQRVTMSPAVPLVLTSESGKMQHMPSAMIQLTQEQHLALERSAPEPLRAIDPATNAQYVLVRSDDYEQLTVAHSEKHWVRDVYPAAMEVFARDGWDDPRMDVYNASSGATVPRQST